MPYFSFCYFKLFCSSANRLEKLQFYSRNVMFFQLFHGIHVGIFSIITIIRIILDIFHVPKYAAAGYLPGFKMLEHLVFRGNQTMEFKDRLKSLRKEKRLTQVKLGEMLNYGYTAIANYESGRNQPSIPDLKKIASIFNVSMDYLLGVNDIRHPYVIDDNTAKFNEFRRFYALLNEDSKSELLLYMQWLVERENKIRNVVYYEDPEEKNNVQRAAQESEEYR